MQQLDSEQKNVQASASLIESEYKNGKQLLVNQLLKPRN